MRGETQWRRLASYEETPFGVLFDGHIDLDYAPAFLLARCSTSPDLGSDEIFPRSEDHITFRVRRAHHKSVPIRRPFVAADAKDFDEAIHLGPKNFFGNCFANQHIILLQETEHTIRGGPRDSLPPARAFVKLPTGDVECGVRVIAVHYEAQGFVRIYRLDDPAVHRRLASHHGITYDFARVQPLWIVPSVLAEVLSNIYDTTRPKVRITPHWGIWDEDERPDPEDV